MFRSLTSWIAVALCFSLFKLHGAGVTVITHGFNSDIEGWIVPMAASIAARSPLRGTNSACYEIRVTENAQSQLVSATTFLGGTNALDADSGEILIKLDWSALDTGQASTTEIADVAAAALLATNTIPGLSNALAELPLHLCGHSRGASVVAELARFLGAQGVWVDQITTLDPRPVSSLGDPSMKLYANILYVDNYWQNMGDGLFVPNGQSLNGAYNRHLTSLNGGYSSAHSDVHLWYHGTIDFTPNLTVDGATIGETQRQNWWTTYEARGTNTGFHFSLIVGGDRLSDDEPAGAGNGRISDGFNKVWDLGGGVAPNRDALPVNNGAWPNPLLFSHNATNPMPLGSSLGFTLHYQTGSNQPSAQLSVYLDPDQNAFNTNEIELLQANVAATGINNVFLASTNVTLTGPGLSPGTYWLCAGLTSSNRMRYLYAPNPVQVIANLQPPSLTALSLSNGVFRLLLSGNVGDQVVTEFSTNFATWTPFTTNMLNAETIELEDPDAASDAYRFYRSWMVAPN